MQYQFEEWYPQPQRPYAKRHLAREAGIPDEGIPLTIADMEFQSPPEIIEEMCAVAASGLYGYCEVDAGFRRAVAGWMRERQGWPAKEEDMVAMPGMVAAAQCAIQAFTKPGEGVLVHSPNYPPFFSLPKRLGRSTLIAPLACQNGRYALDMDSLATAAAQGAKMMLLCSPHNPCGRVWRQEELLQIAEFCQARHLTLFVDEIHADIILPGRRFVAFGSLPKEYLENVLLGTSASKTFSLGGLSTASIFIPNEKMKIRYLQQMEESGLFFQSLFGLVATRAGYEKGAAWAGQMVQALQKNYQALAAVVQRSGQALQLFPLEGSYLAWLDCQALGLSERELMDFFWQKPGFYAASGRPYGGQGFLRINLACPHREWRHILENLESKLSILGK